MMIVSPKHFTHPYVSRKLPDVPSMAIICLAAVATCVVATAAVPPALPLGQNFAATIGAERCAM